MTPSLLFTAKDMIVLIWRTNRQGILLTLILSLFFGLAPSLSLWLSKLLVNYLTGATPNHFTGYLISLFVALIFLQLVTNSLGSWMMMIENNMRDKVGGDVQEQILASVSAQQGLAFFEDPKNVHRLELAKTAQQRLGNFIYMANALIDTIIPLAGALVLAATLAWWIPLVLCITIAPSSYIKYHVDQGEWGAERDLVHLATKMRHHENILLSLTFAKDVRAFNISGWLRKNWKESFIERYNTISTIRREGLLKFILSSVLNTAGIAFCYFYVILQVLKQQLTVGDLVMFMGLFQHIRSNLFTIVFGSSNIMKHLSALQPLSELMHIVPDLPLQAEHPPYAEQGIVLSNVSFSYGDKTILKDINLHINHGEMVVIVGENGAGKTTLVKLLCRFYDPDEGMIRFDGRNIASIPVDDYREHLAVAHQDFAKFPLSLKNNILFGVDGNVTKSLEDVGLHQLVETLPEGVKTPLSREIEGGTDLSGGQWQRLAIARALQRKDADVIILDEPTAALDPNTEKEILEMFHALTLKRTAIIVSHRMSMATKADKIIVMEAGEIVEMGNHQQLMTKQGHYHTMFMNQAENYQQKA